MLPLFVFKEENSILVAAMVVYKYNFESENSIVESRNIVAVDQNGFREKRSTIDHISSPTNLIDTRKKLKKSTVCASIDF